MGKEVIILRGLPGAGKTTWTHRWRIDHPDYLRVSCGDIRNMLYTGEYLPGLEPRVRAMRDSLIFHLLRDSFSVIVDDTNLDNRHVRHIESIVHDASVWSLVINTPIDECIRRDALRPEPVGAAVIREMAVKLDDELKHMPHYVSRITTYT